MSGTRLAVPLGLAIILAIAALTLGPRAFEAHSLLADQDDPSALADRAMAQSFNAAVAAREINAALEAGDADLASSFVDLARERQLLIDPKLAERVKTAKA